MAIGFIKKKATIKSFTKKALSVLPFTLNDDKRFGLAIHIVGQGLAHKLTSHTSPFENSNFLQDQWEIIDYCLDVTSKAVGITTERLDEISSHAYESVPEENRLELSRITIDFTTSRSAIDSKN